MKINRFTLNPADPQTPRVKIEIQDKETSMMTIVDPGQPRFLSTGKIRVAKVTVHERGEAKLSERTMRERASDAGKTPINSLQDLEEVLTRGLKGRECDDLETGILMRGATLYLSYHNGKWDPLYSVPDANVDKKGAQILCYDER